MADKDKALGERGGENAAKVTMKRGKNDNSAGKQGNDGTTWKECVGG